MLYCEYSIEPLNILFKPFFAVVNEKLCSPVDSLSVVCNKKSLCQMAAHFVASLLVSCVLTSLIGGRYGDMIVSCDGIGNNR